MVPLERTTGLEPATLSLGTLSSSAQPCGFRPPRASGQLSVWPVRERGEVLHTHRRGVNMPERTKEQLLKEAKRLNIKGRSKMNKGALQSAINRRK